MKTFVVLMAGLACAGLCFAEGEEVLQPLMKTVAATSGKLRKDVEAKSTADITAGATQLQGVYKQMGDYFTKRGGMPDAVKISRDAEAAAKDLAGAAGNDEKVAASMKVIGGSCGGCHMAHREKVGDVYKIK